MRDTKKIRVGMRDEIILLGPGYGFFHSRDAGCFEIEGRIGSDRGLQKSFDDQKNA